MTLKWQEQLYRAQIITFIRINASAYIQLDHIPALKSYIFINFHCKFHCHTMCHKQRKVFWMIFAVNSIMKQMLLNEWRRLDLSLKVYFIYFFFFFKQKINKKVTFFMIWSRWVLELCNVLICTVKKTCMVKTAAKWTRGGPSKQASIINGTRPELCSAGGPYDNPHRLWPRVSVQRIHVPLILTPRTSSSSLTTLYGT